MNQRCTIAYNAINMTKPLIQIVDNYGDALEGLKATEKLELLTILSYWQKIDTDRDQSEGDGEPYSLEEAIEDLPVHLSGSAIEALDCIADIDSDSCFKLMVAIAHQIAEGIYLPEDAE